MTFLGGTLSSSQTGIQRSTAEHSSTGMIDTKIVRNILDTALREPGTSKLTKESIDSVGAYLSPNNRHLLNNLGAISHSYFEVGSHRGGSMISAGFENPHLLVIGCDNFSHFPDPTNDPEIDLQRNCVRLLKGHHKVLKMSAWDVVRSNLWDPIDLFFSDGSHTYEDQRRAITHFVPFMAEQCIVVVDDFSWHDTNAGTMKGFKDAGVDILLAATLYSGTESDCTPRGFWNGLGVFVIQKPT